MELHESCGDHAATAMHVTKGAAGSNTKALSPICGSKACKSRLLVPMMKDVVPRLQYMARFAFAYSYAET